MFCPYAATVLQHHFITAVILDHVFFSFHTVFPAGLKQNITKDSTAVQQS